MTYQFKILAQNKYGDGVAQATSVSIITGDAPDIPNAPTTSIASGSVYVDITWTAPASNNNFAEDKYLVQILKSDGITWYEDTTYCDGSHSTIFADLKCSIPLTVLRSTTYGLAYGNVIYAKVKAHNDRGWSDFSAASSALGATVQTEPLAMSAPVNGAATSES